MTSGDRAEFTTALDCSLAWRAGTAHGRSSEAGIWGISILPNLQRFDRFAIFIIVAMTVASCRYASNDTTFPQALFTKHVIDSTTQPSNSHCKDIADFNGDGENDVVVCSAGGDGLWWYEWPSWTRHAIRSTGRYSTDMQVGDINGDGQIDIMVPKTPDGNIGNDMFWYENPGGDATGTWPEHHIGAQGSHDVEKGDFNGDGQLDVIARMGDTGLFLNQNHGASFQKVSIGSSGQEGTIVGDFDSDGDMDIGSGGDGVRWFENVDGKGTSWKTHEIDGGWPAMTGMAAGDVNNDGKTDIGITCSESANCSMVWYEQPSWKKHTIATGVSYVHTFKFRDMNGDGCLDAVWGEMHQSSQDRIAVSYNRDCKGDAWDTQVIDTSGIHNLRVGDIGGDYDLDIFGTNWNTGSPDKGALKWFENMSQLPPKVGPGSGCGGTTTNGPTGETTGGATTGTTGGTTGSTIACCIGLDSWHYIHADASRAGGPTGGYFGLGFADLNQDGFVDIVSGKYFYMKSGRRNGRHLDAHNLTAGGGCASSHRRRWRRQGERHHRGSASEPLLDACKRRERHFLDGA